MAFLVTQTEINGGAPGAAGPLRGAGGARSISAAVFLSLSVSERSWAEKAERIPRRKEGKSSY